MSEATCKPGRPPMQVGTETLNTTVPVEMMNRILQAIGPRGMTIAEFVRQTMGKKLECEGVTAS